jgi:UDPglucose--hexose-1-phosphate uridylyltransferase
VTMDRTVEARPHRRLNQLTGEWVLVSPHRASRPWSGQMDHVSTERRPSYDSDCYLCPGNRRASGLSNPAYERTFVFDNDFSALLPEASTIPATSDDPLLVAEAARGTCRVICFSPRHDLSLGDLDPEALAAVVDTWARETASLGAAYSWVQVFENRGTMMGCSNLHPHGQIWASTAIPNEALKEDRRQREHFARHGGPLLLHYAAREIAAEERVAYIDDDWVAVVPFWAVWPFETLLLPRRPTARLPDLAPSARANLAVALRAIVGRYDRLFGVPFPYSMGWHGAPFTDDSTDPWQLHAHIFPPLLRSASVRKHMVGYEMLAEPQRDLTPEAAAKMLRALGGE